MPEPEAPHPGEGFAGKIPLPNAVDVERELLAAVVGSGEPFSWVVGELSPDDFFLQSHKLLYRTLEEMNAANCNIDLVTVIGALRSTGRLEAIGGNDGVANLIQRSGIPGSLNDYAKIIRLKSLKRRAIETAQALVLAACSESEASESMLELSFSHVREIEGEFAEFRCPPTAWNQAAVKVGMQAYEDDTSETLVLPTGLPPLDEHLPSGGFEAGWIVVGMTLPGGGKTMYALNNFTKACCEAGKRGAYFSCEMRAERLSRRAIAGQSRVFESAFKRRKKQRMSDEAINAWMQAADHVANWNLRVDKMRPVTQIDAICRRIHKQEGLDFVVVDYVQQCKNPGMSGPDNIEFTMIKLQELAQDLGIVILVLSQPSTDSRRTGKITGGSDAKGSGAIEEAADMFFVLEREYVGEGGFPLAGLRMVKGRDVLIRSWHASPQEIKRGKTVKIEPACGWKWDDYQLKIVCPPTTGL